MKDLQNKIIERCGSRALRTTPLKDETTLRELVKKVEASPFEWNDAESIENHPLHNEICHILPFVGVKQSVKELGKEVIPLIYQELYHAGSLLLDPFLERCKMDKLFDEELYRIAQSAHTFNPYFLKKHNTNEFIRLNYLALEKVSKMKIPSDVVEESILLNLRKNAKINSRALGRYSADIVIPQVASGVCPKWGYVQDKGDLYYDIGVDGVFGTLLMHREVPNAIVSFRIDERDTLKIVQSQGVRPYLIRGVDLEKVKKEELPRVSSGALAQISMRDALLEFGEHIAKTMGMKEIAIQSGYNNKWIKPLKKGENPHLPIDAALEAYDAFAQRNGFKQRKPTGDWYRKI